MKASIASRCWARAFKAALAVSGSVASLPAFSISSSTRPIPLAAMPNSEQGIDAHVPLLDQQLSLFVQHQRRLLLLALDRHEVHVGPRHGLADRGRVGGVVLTALE
jgi:hypothetical protein